MSIKNKFLNFTDSSSELSEHHLLINYIKKNKEFNTISQPKKVVPDFNSTAKESSLKELMNCYVDPLLDRQIVLTQALRNLFMNYKYIQEYCSFLLGTETQLEFEKKTEKYTYPFIEMSNELIQKRMDIILNIFKNEIDYDDISQMLNVEPLKIAQYLKQNNIALIKEEDSNIDDIKFDID